MLNVRGRSLADVVDGTKRYIDDKGIRVVVLDSISRSGFGRRLPDPTAHPVPHASFEESWWRVVESPGLASSTIT